MQYPPKQIGLRHIDWESVALSTKLPNISKSLIMYLARFMNRDQDIAWPSQARMMSELSISNGSLNNHLKLLESEGWIIRHSGNSKNNTRYLISFPKIVTDKLHQMEKIGESNSPPDGDSTPPDGDRVLHQVETNRQVNRPSNRQGVPRENYPQELNVSAWKDFIAHRKEMRIKKLTKKGEDQQIEKLIRLSKERQRECIDYTTSNGYQGLFPEKFSGEPRGRPGNKNNADRHLEALRNL